MYCIPSIHVVVMVFFQPQEVTSSISFNQTLFKQKLLNGLHCSSVRQPHMAFQRFFIIDDGNYLFSTNALSANPSDSLMTFLIRINKQSKQHSNYRLKHSSVTGDCVFVYLSKRPILLFTLTQCWNHTPALQAPIAALLTHTALCGPGACAVEQFRAIQVQTPPLTHSPQSGFTPEPTLTLWTLCMNIS